MSKTEKATETVRLQIPTRESVANEIASLADQLDRTQAWLAGRMLEVAVEDNGKVGEWLLEKVSKAVGQVLGKKKQTAPEETIRLQVTIRKDVAEQITSMGKGMNHSQVRMAEMLLETALENNAWIIRHICSPWLKLVSALEGQGPVKSESGKKRTTQN